MNRRAEDFWERELVGSPMTTVLNAIKSGLLDELFNQGLIPEIEFERTELDGQGIQKLTCRARHIQSPAPHEWTLQMLCDAAIAYIRVLEISSTYGFTLIDAHFNNILFCFGQPLFIDLGSFQEALKPTWSASQDYKTEMLRPIQLVNRGYSKFVRMSIEKGSISRDRLWTLSHPLIFRFLEFVGIGKHLVIFRERFATIGVFNVPQALLSYSLGYHRDRTRSFLINRFSGKHNLVRFFLLILNFSGNLIKPILLLDPENEKKNLIRIRNQNSDGYWSNYYDSETPRSDQGDYGDRFSKHLDLIRSRGISSITDLGGNDGRFVRWLVQLGDIQFGFVLDADEAMIDLGRSESLKNGSQISFGLLDLTAQPSPDRIDQDRFESDLVCALGLLHHLCLRYRMSFSHALSNICSFGCEYVMIEFMPDGLSVNPMNSDVPNWYTEANFEIELTAYATIINRVEVEPTRILYFCKIKNETQSNS